MKYLISASAGFVFSNYVGYLQQHTSHDIVGIDKLTYCGSLLNCPECKRYKLYIGDVCDNHFVSKILEIERPDVIISAAAETHVDRSIDGPSVFINTNIVGTHSMLEAARKYPPKLFVNISSDEIYGSVETGQSKETDPMRPRSPYSASKASADLLGQAYIETYGLPVITIRSSNIFGSRQHPEKFIPKAITNILAGKKVPLYGNGRNRRSWIYVKDFFWALQAIIERGKIGEAYNIGGVEKENIEVLNLILQMLNAEESFIEHVQDRLGHDIRYSVNDDKLKALGWAPKYPFEEALAKTCGWYQANGYWFMKGKT